MGAGVGWGEDVGSMETCHDYLIYANDDYTKWVTAIGSFVSRASSLAPGSPRALGGESAHATVAVRGHASTINRSWL